MIEPFPRISNRFLIHLDRIYLERGGNLQKVMSMAGLPYETLLGEGLMVPFENHIRMLELSEQELGVRPLGLVLATRQLVAHLSPIFDILLNQPSVNDSVLALCENLQRVVEGLQATLRVDGDVAYVELVTDYPFLNKSAIFQDHAAGLVAQYLRWIVGKKFKMTSVSIPHTEPRDLLRFRSFFGCPVSFGDSYVAICFDKNVLQKSVQGRATSSNREYNEILQWDRHASLLAQVRNIIRSNIASNSYQVDVVAKALKLSTRTLQRRLAERGTTFHQQLDSVRAGLARQFVYCSNLDLADISQQLGYADQACFTRSFQRWYAKPPSEWRRVLRGTQTAER